MTDIIVRWDGTANTEWGRYLEAQPDPVRPAQPLRSVAPVRLSSQLTRVEIVRRAMRAYRGRWFTATDIAALTGMTISVVNGAIYPLVTSGDVERELPAEDGARKRGQRYRWSAA